MPADRQTNRILAVSNIPAIDRFILTDSMLGKTINYIG